MITRFEITRNLRVQPSQERKSAKSGVIEDVAAIVEQSIGNVVSCTVGSKIIRVLAVILEIFL